MVEREIAIEEYLESSVAKLGGIALKFTVPGIRGYMDRLCILPGGIIFFVEVKRPKGGVLAELQKTRRDELQRLGCRCYVVKNREEINGVIREERIHGQGLPAQEAR